MNTKTVSLLVLAFSLSSSFAQAQSFTVKKVKGRQAVIQIHNGSFYEGQSVDVGGSSSSSFSSSSSSGNRGKFLGLAGSLTSTKPSNVQYTSLQADALYGFNKGNMEYGLLGRLGTTSGGSVNVTTFGIGAKFDYNLVENNPGTPFVYGVGGEAVYSSVSSSSSSSVITLFPSFSAKWFLLGTPTAFRLDAGIELNQRSSGSSNSSDTGLKMTLGLYNYF